MAASLPRVIFREHIVSDSLAAFIHELDYSAIPDDVLKAARIAVLDLLGVAAAGTQTKLASIIREHAVQQFAAGQHHSARILFDGRACSAVGATLAGGMIIDSVDAHDGHKLTKGHVGCGVLPALLAFAEATSLNEQSEFLSALVMGYEIGSRAGIALHQTACDYHTSGAWIALAAAAIGSRALGLTAQSTEEALGIAEYHGPRSQMMRCIDSPTMVKDGSGWGAMAGVSAAYMAQAGFTGAPALTTNGQELDNVWSDLGSRWHMLEQYLKPFPVCRWAQPAIIAALKLKAKHSVEPATIRRIEIGTFHEAKRLHTQAPATTEQAQYSLPFPVAVALRHADVTVQHIDGQHLHDQCVLSLSQKVTMHEIEAYNAEFPARRISHVSIELSCGTVLESGPTEAAGDPEHPLSEEAIEAKFMSFATPVLGEQAACIKHCVSHLGDGDLHQFHDLLYSQPSSVRQSLKSNS